MTNLKQNGIGSCWQVGYGSKCSAIRMWIAGVRPCFHLPGFNFEYLCLTHTQLANWQARQEQDAGYVASAGTVEKHAVLSAASEGLGI